MGNKLNELSMFEVDVVEKTAGLPITAAYNTDSPKALLYGAIAWVHKKQTEPTLKFKDYMSTAKLDDVIEYIDLFAEDDVDDEDDAPAEVGDGEPFPVGLDTDAAGDGAGEAPGPVLPLDEVPAV